MTESIDEPARRLQVPDGASSYPRVVPGDDLAAAISAAADRTGRAVWRLGPGPSGVRVLVPILWLDLTAPGVLSGPSEVPNPAVVLKDRLALYLETQHEVAFDQLKPQDRTQWRRLWAAALHDIHGVSIKDAVGAADLFDEAHANKTIGEGRRLWKQLAYAWPWHYFESPAGTPPAGWHASGGAPLLDATFEVWRSGRLGGMRFSDRAAA